MQGTQRLSGRQITIMFVAACAAVVLAPVGVMAAGHSSVSIADGKHPSRLAVVGTSGAQLVNVSGSTTIAGKVTAVPGKPGTPYLATGSSSTGNTLNVAVPTGAHFVVETVSGRIEVVAPVTVAGIDINFVENGHASHLYVSLPRVSPNDGTAAAIFMNTVPAAIYPDPGSTVNVTAEFDAAVSSTMNVTLSGYRS